MGIAHKADTIKWQFIAIENLYRKKVPPQSKDLKFNNHDIESEYSSSILFEECYWSRLSYVKLVVFNCFFH